MILAGRKAPGVLMVSGHTPDGFRSNNLGGDPKSNDPADDDYQVVEINLVRTRCPRFRAHLSSLCPFARPLKRHAVHPPEHRLYFIAC